MPPEDATAPPAVERLAAWRGDALLVATRILGDRELAEDAVQQAFVNALRRPTAIPAGDARLWLIRVAANAAKDLARGEARRRQRALGAPAAPAVDDDPPGDDDARLVREAMRELPPPQRAALAARFELGLSFRDAARALGVPSPLLRLRVSRALARLRRRFAHAGPARASVLIALVGGRRAAPAAAKPTALAWSIASVAVVAAVGTSLALSRLAIATQRRAAPQADAAPAAAADQVDARRAETTRQRIAAVVDGLRRVGADVGSAAVVLQREAHLGGIFQFDASGVVAVPTPAVAATPGVDGRDDNRFLSDAQLALPHYFASPWGRADRIGAHDPNADATLAQLDVAHVYRRGAGDRLAAVTLLELAGALPRSDDAAAGDAAQDAYLRDRDPQRPWNDAWGHPLIVAWGLFQPGGDDALAAGRRCAEALREYQFNRSVSIAVAAIGPVAADASGPIDLAARAPAAFGREVLPRLWRAAVDVCDATAWTPATPAQPPWSEVRRGDRTVAGVAVTCWLSPPVELR